MIFSYRQNASQCKPNESNLGCWRFILPLNL